MREYGERWDPRGYRESASEQRRWAREVIAKLELRGDERVLDIGCGDGSITAEIAKMLPGGSAVGIDISPQMVSFANESFSPTTNPNLSFCRGDASCLEFEEEFDLVVSFACLHWVRDHPPVLEGIGRALGPNGWAYLQFGGRGNASGILMIAESMIAEDRWKEGFIEFEEPYSFFDSEEYRGWIEEAGLVPIRVELIEKDMVQPGRRGLEAWIKTTWHPYLERLTADRAEEFVAEVAGRYLQTHTPDDEGKVHVRMVRLEAVFGRSGSDRYRMG